MGWLTDLGSNEIDDFKGDVEQSIAKIVGEVLTSGFVLTFSLPEFMLDSIVQALDPVTDPFLIAIRETSPKAETPIVSFSLFRSFGVFWRNTPFTEINAPAIALKARAGRPDEVGLSHNTFPLFVVKGHVEVSISTFPTMVVVP